MTLDQQHKDSVVVQTSSSSSPQSRPHRRGRGRHSQLKKGNVEKSLTTTEPVAPKIAHPGGKWQRKLSAEVTAAPASTPTSIASGLVFSQNLGASMPQRQQQQHQQQIASPLVMPPFPAITLPVWCRSASAVAYPLSEDGLTNELLDFFRYVQLTTQEVAARTRLLRCVEAAVDALWNTPLSESDEKTARVALYGSYALGLSLPSSDIDLVLTFPAEERQEAAERQRRTSDGEDEDSSEAVEAARERQARHLQRLHDLAEHLRSCTQSLPLQVDVYDQCRIPRIHLRDMSPGGVSCDVNSSLSSERVARIVSRQQRWLKDAPLAAFLVRVTKAAVKQWDLNEVFAGGLASTALYCLVLRFLAQAEQLHRSTKMSEENLSPPRYDEATLSVSSLIASICASPLPPSSPTAASGVFPLVATAETATAPTATFNTGALSAASIPSYVPSWVRNSSKYAAAESSPTVPVAEERKLPVQEAATTTATTAAEEEGSTSVTSVKTCSLGAWANGSSRSSACVDGEDNDDDAELDALTQEALTRTSCATTTSTTPTNRTATNTPPPPSCASATGSSAHASTCGGAEKVSESGHAAQQSVSGMRTGVHDDYPTAEELTKMAQTRYGASPARLLLKLWRALSADAFLSGYQVADVFGDDTVWATCELAGFSGRPSAQPGVANLELATYASRSSTDLSAASFRLPDLLALFRCSSSSLDNMLRFQRYPRRMAPTMLSTIFVDPRMQA